MENQSCCFMGERKIKDMEYKAIQKRLEEEIVSLIVMRGIRSFLVRGELGFDTMAALSVLSLKPKFPHIKLILMLPFIEQNVYWPEDDINTYKFILDNVDSVIYTSKHYHAEVMMNRDRHVVDISKACISHYLDPHDSEFISRYALEKGIEIIQIV